METIGFIVIGLFVFFFVIGLIKKFGVFLGFLWNWAKPILGGIIVIFLIACVIAALKCLF